MSTRTTTITAILAASDSSPLYDYDDLPSDPEMDTGDITPATVQTSNLFDLSEDAEVIEDGIRIIGQ